MSGLLGSPISGADDYFGAAAKHSGAALSTRGRLPDTAAYLSGYVVECSLKALVLACGERAREFGHDLPKLQGTALNLLFTICRGTRRYSVPADPAIDDLITNWRPELRYHAAGSVPRAVGCRWAGAASRVFRATALQARLDGVL